MGREEKKKSPQFTFLATPLTDAASLATDRRQC